MSGFVRIQTELPGPESRRLLARKAAALPRGAYHNLPVFIRSAANACLEDMDGNRFIDFGGGIGVMNAGHANPDVVAAAREQLGRFTHTCFHLTMYEGYVALAEKLNALTPGSFEKRTFFLNSGAEGIENAVKIARYATGRPGVISFEHSFHGRTQLGMALTGKVAPYSKNFPSAAPDVHHIPLPHCFRCPSGCSDTCCLDSDAALERIFATRIDPESVAAILFEPVLGEGGFIQMHTGFLERLARFARSHGILLIADEIQTGWGRTGENFAMAHFPVEADIIVSAKSIAGGLPLSAVTGRAEIMDRVHPGGIGSTFGGNPVSCAAALAVVKMFETGEIAKRAIEIGERVRTAFHALAEQCPHVGDVRGIGAMNAIELVHPGGENAPAPELTVAIQKKCFETGLIVLKAGTWGNVIRTLMPLTIEWEALDEGLAVMAAAVLACSNQA